MERPARAKRSSLWNGWPLLGWTSLGVVAMTAIILATQGSGEEGWRMVIRATARSSYAFFLLAFAASGLRRIWRHEATAWLLRNRRQLGVSFAFSHAVHALAIGVLAVREPSFRAEFDALTVVAGTTAYLFLAAMTATSFDRSAAWLGRRRWSQLHTAGSWFLWVIFLNSYGGRAGDSLAYLALALGLVAVAALRLSKRFASRRGVATA